MSLSSGRPDVRVLLTGYRELHATIKNPFRLAGRGTAERVFNRLPAQLDEALALKSMDEGLWDEVARFYRETRNPLFHGCEIAEADPTPVWQALELIWRLFEWLNSWHAVDGFASGPVRLTDPDSLRTVPDPHPYAMMALIPERKLTPDIRESLTDDDFVQLPGVEEITGMCIGAEEHVEFSMRTHDGRTANLRLSAHAAMQMLGGLALAKQQRGWSIPDRIF